MRHALLPAIPLRRSASLWLGSPRPRAVQPFAHTFVRPENRFARHHPRRCFLSKELLHGVGSTRYPSGKRPCPLLHAPAPAISVIWARLNHHLAGIYIGHAHTGYWYTSMLSYHSMHVSASLLSPTTWEYLPGAGTDTGTVPGVPYCLREL